MKTLLILTALLMPNPVIPYNPNNEKSSIPTIGMFVVMNGLYQNKVQDVNVDLSEFTRKTLEISEELFHVNSDGAIIVNNVCFVMGRQTFDSGEAERFDRPFADIQSAINATQQGALNWTVIVYPGAYIGDLVIPDNLNMYFYGGVTVLGNIQLGSNTHLQFDCGSVIDGDLTDNGINIISEICGCVVHEGDIILSGASSILTISGRQMHKATISGGSTLHCHFERMKASLASRINGSANAVINIYGLEVLSTGYISSPINITGGSATLEMYDCIVNTTGAGIFFDGLNGLIWNSKIKTNAPAITCDGAGTFQGVNNYIESTQDEAVLCVLGSTNKLILRRNNITTVNSSSVNIDAVKIDAGNALVLEENTLIAKGTGNSVNSFGAVNIKSLVGNGSNAAVNGLVTETISTILVDVNYE